MIHALVRIDSSDIVSSDIVTSLLAAGGGPAPLVAGIAVCFLAAAVLALVSGVLRLPSAPSA